MIRTTIILTALLLAPLAAWYVVAFKAFRLHVTSQGTA